MAAIDGMNEARHAEIIGLLNRNKHVLEEQINSLAPEMQEKCSHLAFHIREKAAGVEFSVVGSLQLAYTLLQKNPEGTIEELYDRSIYLRKCSESVSHIFDALPYEIRATFVQPDNWGAFYKEVQTSLLLDWFENTDLSGVIHLTLEARHRLDKINVLPEEIMRKFTSLTALSIINHSFTEMPNVVREFRQLRELHFDNNKLEAVPHWINELNLLKTLSVSQNKIKEFPDLSVFPHLRFFSIVDNPLETLAESFTQQMSWPAEIGINKESPIIEMFKERGLKTNWRL